MSDVSEKSDIRHGWKVLTHDYRPPIQGGDPLWDGQTLPHSLPFVKVDRGEANCAPGWNYCASLATALRIAGLWPNGRPSIALAVEAGRGAIERGETRRASTLSLLRTATDEEIAAAITEMSQPFGEHAKEMCAEQLAWRSALSRPGRDAVAVEAGLREALSARGLVDWSLRRFDSAWDAWDARAAWDAWDARDARDARDALVVRYAARRGWISADAEIQTAGIRSAYESGLALCLPTGAGELGWAMEE